jgi:hypothetical protein
MTVVAVAVISFTPVIEKKTKKMKIKNKIK